MSGIILIVVAVILLGVAIYSLVSYVKERRASQLPTHKKKKIAPLDIPRCATTHHRRIKAGVMPAFILYFLFSLNGYDSQACSALRPSNCGGG